MASLQHIHLVSLDKYALAKWYEKFLDFKIIEDIEKLGEKNGPLFISSDNSNTAISIFNVSTLDKPEAKTNCIPAFSVTASDFIEKFYKFKQEVDGLEIIDHILFYSFYVNDLHGTRIEICCFELENIKKALIEESLVAKRFT